MRSGVFMGGMVCAATAAVSAMAAGGPAPGETQAQPPRGVSEGQVGGQIGGLADGFGEVDPNSRPLRERAIPSDTSQIGRGPVGAEDVPSPGTVALLAVGGLVIGRRQRR